MSEVMGAFKQLALAETYINPGNREIWVNDSIALTPSFGAIWYTSVDLGFPDVRASSQENPQSDGTFDETQFTGARTVTLEGVVLNDAYGETAALSGWDNKVGWNSASWWVSYLSAWASPARRYRFYFTDEHNRSRFLDVRGDSFTAEIEKSGHAYRNFQLNMVNPSGKIYQFSDRADSLPDGRRVWTVDFSTDNDPGRLYPETYPRDYPDQAYGEKALEYEGSVPNGCLIRLQTGTAGLQGPRIKFYAPDETTMEIGLSNAKTFAAGTTIYFDTVARTAIYREANAPTDLSAMTWLSAPMQWPLLKPGINLLANDSSGRVRGYNRVEFTATSVAADAKLDVIYYPADLL
jgi:hypothetical protein